MPELPEVETVCRGLKPLEKAQIKEVDQRRKDLRIPFPAGFAKRLEGKRITKIDRRAKYVLVHLSDKNILVIHLGMSGKLLLTKNKPALKKHDHVLFHFSGGWWLVFNDARRFGLMTIVPEAELKTHKLFKDMGVEPLSKNFSGKTLHAALKKKTVPIKTAIMDQRVVVGVGNIYASEALFGAKIHPQTPACELPLKKCDALANAIKNVLKSAIASGGSTLRDYVRSSGDMGYFQHAFTVYGRKDAPCVTCGNLIKRITMQGRSTFYCPTCQKR